MLQQILKTMYVDPEILSELSEEQKQLLFFKMREEQVRRYKEWDEKEAKKPKKQPKPGKRRIQFLKGADGEPWTWVMGEGRGDATIEEIMDREDQLRAQRLAEKEAEELKRKNEELIRAKLQAEKEKLEQEKQRLAEEARRKEAEAHASRKEAKLAAERARKAWAEQEKQAKELEKRKEAELKCNNCQEPVLQRKEQMERRRSFEEVHKKAEKRAKELYMSLKEARETAIKEAEQEQERKEREWREQLQKQKEADKRRSMLARNAREEFRRSVHMAMADNKKQTVYDVAMQLQKQSLGGAATATSSSKTSSPTQASLPARPTSRQEVIRWFQDFEQPRQAGMDARTHQVAKWFHGIISRQEAEALLEGRPVGSFLVRVSERVWGYTISYRGEGRFKHFLIDTSDNTYQFFGTNQLSHGSLWDLVNFHMKEPISSTGGEVLKTPCGQTKQPPDYRNLMGESQNSSWL
ncbi:PREDICTED: SH2 domain-containing protein 4B-like [Branchiostoma belcheri]|uniref:SH2 domain-containing protein 4B-like n=1 Tax=Branchiostoma belcheri TaxID=7741 RepID=A0A6P4ZRC4_BRABE|nr:PREDICTED: SH2 domain-containing protein 4B-like [Branchiostoma belcheri]